MRTMGVDLSAAPKKTGIAWVEWSEGQATVQELHVGRLSDAELVDEMLLAEKVGVDCPLGWPLCFLRFVGAHEMGHVDPADTDRRILSYRETDLFVMQQVRIQGLSVAADRLGSTAMRCAVLLAMLNARGAPVDRSGGGSVVEVYPAASLARWGLNHKGYKRPVNLDARAALIESMLMKMPWLSLGEFEDDCRRSDDALDAVICAVTARYVVTGNCAAIPTEHLKAARVEGWIALPSISPEHYPQSTPGDRLSQG